MALFSLENIPSATEFTLSITTVCVFDNLKTISEEEKVAFMTLPFPPKNLELESRYVIKTISEEEIIIISRFCNSFQVKWEAG